MDVAGDVSRLASGRTEVYFMEIVKHCFASGPTRLHALDPQAVSEC